jgi:DNA-binding GntR family transcriptional regulator
MAIDGEDALEPAPSLGEQVYQRLRAAIVGGQLELGERLSVSTLASRFGVSTMPVRDALKLLEQDGLVETSPRRWTRVAEIDPSKVHELVPLLSLLEQYAITSAREINADIVDRLDRENERFASAAARADQFAILESDVAFHDALVRLSRSVSVERALQDARTRIGLFRIQTLGASSIAESLGDHRAIVESLRAGDRLGAAEALGRNWERGLTRLR